MVLVSSLQDPSDTSAVLADIDYYRVFVAVEKMPSIDKARVLLQGLPG